jgi:uncharacterized protein YjbI with pentapeptide repeats
LKDNESAKLVQERTKDYASWQTEKSRPIDLSNSDFSGMTLIGVDLRDCDLRGVNFKNADLQYSNLTGADLEGADLSKADFRNAHLDTAYANGAILRGTNFQGATLSETSLTNADLTGANLSETDLTIGYLNNATLSYANLEAAFLPGADFSGADLRNASMNFAVMRENSFVGADLSGCRFGYSTLSDVDLSEARNLALSEHEDHSDIGVNTLASTLRNSGGRFTEAQLIFFESAGVPRYLLDYLPGVLESHPIQFYSCFVSFLDSEPDRGLANRLYTDLKKAGVNVWIYNKDAIAGRSLRANIDRALKDFSKTIVVCSDASLKSPAVVEEIERAVEKEDRLIRNRNARTAEIRNTGTPAPAIDTDVLVPIRLDDSIFEWDSELAIRVKRKYIPDFREVQTDDEKYIQEFDRLLSALDPKTWPERKPAD